jgi:hypothetical protein
VHENAINRMAHSASHFAQRDEKSGET